MNGVAGSTKVSGMALAAATRRNARVLLLCPRIESLRMRLAGGMKKGESLSDEHNKTTKQKKHTEHIIIIMMIINEVLQAFATFILLD